MRDVALITGASRGIGAACARAFAAAGYAVAINYLHSDERAEALARELAGAGHAAKVYRADVADRAAVEAMARQVERDLGSIDTLVVNAGHAVQGLFQELTEAEIRRMFDAHYMGASNPIQAVLPGMIARRRGSIVAVSSVYGVTGASCEGHYAAAKAAQIGLIKSLARECGPSGVRANAVAPGAIDTDMNAGHCAEALCALAAEIPLGRLGTAAEVAEAVLFLARAGYVNGAVLAVDGGWS